MGEFGGIVKIIATVALVLLVLIGGITLFNKSTGQADKIAKANDEQVNKITEQLNNQAGGN